MEYSTEDDLTPGEFSRALQDGNLAEIRPNLPYGVGSDQFALRYILKDFYPALQIDQTQALAINRPTVFHWG